MYKIQCTIITVRYCKTPVEFVMYGLLFYSAIG